MAYTFLKAQGYEIGKSLVDDSKIDYCKEGVGHAAADDQGIDLFQQVGDVYKRQVERCAAHGSRQHRAGC